MTFVLTRPRQFSHSTNHLHLTINQTPALGHPHSNSSAPINYTELEVCVLECYPRPCTTTQITRVLHISEAMQLHNIKQINIVNTTDKLQTHPNRPCAFNCMPTNLRTHNILTLKNSAGSTREHLPFMVTRLRQFSRD